MPHLLLIRHGQSEWNLANRFTGWVDVALTDRGRQEARQAARLVAAEGIAFTKAYTSALLRAQETLDIVLDELGLDSIEIERDEALNERHYGDLQGLDKAETAEKFGAEQVHIWRRSYDVAPPGGESLEDTAGRTLPYFNDRIVADLDGGRSVLVAAHGNSLRSIVMELDRLSKEEVLELNLATGVPIVYEMAAGARVLSKRILTP